MLLINCSCAETRADGILEIAIDNLALSVAFLDFFIIFIRDVQDSPSPTWVAYLQFSISFSPSAFIESLFGHKNLLSTLVSGTHNCARAK
jgi:hypothetical protein